jgi:hypothetical protein
MSGVFDADIDQALPKKSTDDQQGWHDVAKTSMLRRTIAGRWAETQEKARVFHRKCRINILIGTQYLV